MKSLSRSLTRATGAAKLKKKSLSVLKNVNSSLTSQELIYREDSSFYKGALEKVTLRTAPVYLVTKIPGSNVLSDI